MHQLLFIIAFILYFISFSLHLVLNNIISKDNISQKHHNLFYIQNFIYVIEYVMHKTVQISQFIKFRHQIGVQQYG